MNFEEYLNMRSNIRRDINLKYLHTKNLSHKDKTKAKQFGFEIEYVKYLRQTDPLFLMQYAPDPKTQNIAEIAIKEYLFHYHNLNVTKLATSGKDCFVLAGGNVQQVEQAKSGAKTIDFFWEDKSTGKEAWASQKYTSGDGGSQDAARQELERFMHEGRDLSTVKRHNNIIIFAIADGSHYDLRREEMNKSYGVPGRVICCSVNDIKKHWDEFNNA